MKRKLAEVRDNLEEFVQQPDASVLLVGSSDNDVAYVLKILEQIEGGDPSCFYVCFADEFVDASTYAAAVAGRLVQMYAVADEEREARGEPALDPFPETMTVPSTAPHVRIRIAIRHLGRRLPDEHEHRVVLGLLPLKIHDVAAYARFASDLMREGADVAAWRHYGRIVMRDDRAHHAGERAQQARVEGVLSMDVDFSTEALAADLARDAVDPAVPIGERMQAVLQLAMIDLSYKRHAEAIGKFGLLFDYYGQASAPLMQAMCLQGVGDCLRMIGRPADAKKRYQQGLAIAVAAKPAVPLDPPQGADGKPTDAPPLHPNAPPILLNLLLAAGESSMTLTEHADASSYFADASKVAAKCMNPYAAADALERQGDAHLASSEHAPALAAWTDAEAIAQTYKYFVRQGSVLERMQKLHQDAGRRAEASELGRKRDGVRRLEASG